jgi:hypothetical protein
MTGPFADSAPAANNHRTSAERVAGSFNRYLRRIGLPDVRISAEQVRLGVRRAWSALGFWIAYRIDPDDAGQPNLEVYVHHPMMDDFHARIWADGYLEQLEAMHLWFRFDVTMPAYKEAAARENRERNRRIGVLLEERGLLPASHVHAGGSQDPET